MSLPQRDEDWLDNLLTVFSVHPLHERPDDDGDGYIPQVTIKQVPQTLYEDTIADLRDEINDYRTDNVRLAVERKRAVQDAGRITARLNLALAQVHDLARLRRTLERSRWYWRLAALVGWGLWVVALVR
ncbi:MAG: hypothetical protein ACTHMU_09700 [Thermomicrobiales bacterium]